MTPETCARRALGDRPEGLAHRLGLGLFPELCVVCGRPVAIRDRYRDICPACVTRLPWRLPSEMSIPLVSSSLLGLFSAKDYRDARQQRLIVPFHYEETTRRLLRQLKFHDAEEYAHVFAGPMADALRLVLYSRLERERGRRPGRRLAGALDSALVLPVPLSAGRRRERGYNQAERIARPLAALLGLPLIETALWRRRETGRQTQLDNTGRLANMRGAFAASPEICSGATFLLVDDIATSGLTLYEAGSTLRAAGARDVLFVVAASPSRPESLPSGARHVYADALFRAH